MFRFYTPIFILQVFCIYHAYKNSRGNTWFYLILFLPFLGSLIYLYDTFFTQRNLENLSEGLKSVVNSNRKVELLEKQLKFANTLNNRLALGEAYLEIGRAKEAIELYNASLNPNSPQTDILKKLAEAHYFIKDYALVINYGQQIKKSIEFKNSDAHIAYAWSLHLTNDNENAQKEFEKMNVRFSNYKHRFEYAKFLLATDQKAAGKSKLKQLIEEYQDMLSHEKRFKKTTYRAVKALYATL